MTDVDDWHAQGDAVVAACRHHLSDLVGIYVHGSATLGGMTPRSDLDILVVAEPAVGVSALGQALLGAASHPRALELSVVASAAAIQPKQPWPYLLHVNSAEQRVNTIGGAGDPDLIAHYAVTRQSGIALWGPDPEAVFGPVHRAQLLRYLAGELEWGLRHADQRYAVLNACRAVAYAETGRLLSKVDGADWWTRAHGRSSLVDSARRAQQQGTDLGTPDAGAHSFVNYCVAIVQAAS
ncbi:aminoglycoside adenylyltransferase domain-containing protein [Flexivirga sp. B27]